MWVRRLVTMGAVALVASCSSTKAPVALPSDPAVALAGAKALLGTESARFAETTGSAPLDYTGVVDAKSRNWEIKGREYVIRRVGTGLYVQASGATRQTMFVSPATSDRLASGGWAHTRLPNGRELSVVYNDAFPWNLANPAVNATGVTRTGTRSYAGSLAVKGEPTPVTFDLDDRGRFRRITLGATTKPDEPPAVFTFSGFGLATDIKAPPASQVAEEDNPAFLAATGLV
jgi:hypothetical protein